ncbi:MAG: acyl-CoA thioesterase/BAAT N-terminal domain-containing protein [Simkania sp.]|nr:acyl-CoA thioesterase/BAAT N-terminal domain-containing protein [Simkania sp.]
MFAIQSAFTACCLVAATPHVSITQPSGNTIDREVHIQVEQLKPLQIIEVQATAIDQKGELWASHAFFQANVDGLVDVAAQPPLPESSYNGTDAMGLFWSMLPISNDSLSSFKCKDEQFIVEFTIRQEDQCIGKETLTYYLKAPHVQRIDVRENGIIGTLLIPPSEHPLPVIITLSGSNGGLGENRAKLLASNGFAVLALGYFGVEGLPSNLADIPLEYFKTAFTWLKQQSLVDASRIGLYGVSRGAELACILGSFFPDSVQAIVAVVPSSVVYSGLGETPVNTWVYHGKPILPFAPVPQADFSDGKGQDSMHPATLRQYFIDGMQQIDAFTAAAIPVENIRCPILLISGGDDQMWPSDLHAEQILDRLEKNHSSIPCQHLHYPHAGHGINIPNLPIPEPIYYHPVGKRWFSMGGTRAADAQASLDSWTKLVVFFHETFDRESL